MKPKNQGSMKNPDGFGTVGNPTCGDIMTVYIKVKNGQEIFPTSNLKHWAAPRPSPHHPW